LIFQKAQFTTKFELEWAVTPDNGALVGIFKISPALPIQSKTHQSIIFTSFFFHNVLVDLVAVAERLAAETWKLNQTKYSNLITGTEHRDIYKTKIRSKIK
jgi:hypothetical protein